MKRSRAIHLTLVTSVASLLINCENRPTRYCVDENQNVTDDNKCEDNHYSGSFYPHYHWYYGGARGRVVNGTHLSGGSTTPPQEGFVTRSGESFGESERGVIGHAGEAASAGHAAAGAGE
ncbi:MAG: hypothetical protein JO033_06675 [Acidobacteriaceae bacterium]|nr:hypothetical protein [Acidobacteriaceae bacterium]